MLPGPKELESEALQLVDPRIPYSAIKTKNQRVKSTCQINVGDMCLLVFQGDLWGTYMTPPPHSATSAKQPVQKTTSDRSPIP